MQPKKLQHKWLIGKAVLVFVASYLIFLLFWIQVKDGYGYAMTATASKFAAGLKDARVEELTPEKNFIRATFSSLKTSPDMLVDIPVRTSSYTFNAPLTFAIMAALSFFLTRKKRAYAEAVFLLLFIHFLYIFSLEANELSRIFVERNIEKMSFIRLGFYQFLWGFTDNMVIRFEPFLIGFYMFMRFRRPRL